MASTAWSTTRCGTGRGARSTPRGARGDRSLTASRPACATLAASFSGQTADAEAACAEGADARGLDGRRRARPLHRLGDRHPRRLRAVPRTATSEAARTRSGPSRWRRPPGRRTSLPILFWAGLIRTGPRPAGGSRRDPRHSHRERTRGRSQRRARLEPVRPLARGHRRGGRRACAGARRGGGRAAPRPGGDFPAMGAGVALAGALVRRGRARAGCGGRCSRPAADDALPLAPGRAGGPRAFELLTRSLLGSGRRDDAARGGRAGAVAGRHARHCRTADARAPSARSARWRSHAGDPRAAAEPRAGRRRRRPTEAARADRGRAGAPAGRAGARAGGRDGPRRRRAAERRGRASRPAARCVAATRPSVSWAGSAAAPHRRTRPGKAEGDRRRVALRARARGRPAHRRPQDQLPDRRGALPEPQDGRDPHPPSLPQARRVVARRGRARRRARRARRTLGAAGRRMRVRNQGVVPMSGCAAGGMLACHGNPDRKRDEQWPRISIGSVAGRSTTAGRCWWAGWRCWRS